MADLRCPMCGKSNPPEAETCQYCQARLKPLIPTPPNIPPEDGGDVDWLRGLMDESSADQTPPAAPIEAPAGEETAAEEGDMPDWLSRIRQRTQEEDTVSRIGPAPKVEEGQGGAEEELPDWLRDLPLTGSDASGIPAWMQGMRPVGEEPVTRPSGGEAEPEMPSAQEPAEADNEAWLNSLGSWSAGTPTAGQGEAQEPSALQPEAADEAEALPAEVTPDWLKSLGAEAAAPALDEQDNQEWAGLSGGEEAPASAESAPWLPPIDESAAFTPEEPAAPAPQGTPSAAGMTDWLRSLDAESPSPTPAEPVESTHADKPTSTGMTDWLRSLDAETGSAGAAETPAAPLPTESTPAEKLTSSGMTDWLRSLEQESGTTQKAETPAAEQVFPSGEPGWLDSLEQSAEALPPVEPGAALPGQPEESMPDWLSAAATEETPAPAQPFTEPGAALPAEGLPEWLRAIEPQQAAPGTPAFAGAEPAEPVGPFSGDEIPTWVPSSEQLPGGEESFELPAFTVETEESKAAQSTPPATEALPDWMSSEAAEAEEIEDTGGMIEQAQLPAWLQAMRPLESAVQGRAASLDEERIEKSGPLAGMSGVLPGEEVVTQYHKPPAYSTRLRVSDKQQVLANLLETVVAEESLSQPLQAEPTRAPQFIVRLLVGLGLVAALVIALLAGPFIGVPKGQITTGAPANEVFRYLDDLPAGAPVLVAVEYEAGLSGEMKAAALPVIQHLMSRKARLVLVSSQVVGPVLGEELLKQAASSARGGVTTYAIPQSSANLGYLVGGAMALRELAAPMNSSNPRPLKQALPAPLRAVDGWDGLVLKSLSQVTDFKRILLLTDSIESGRNWIEQVQPAVSKRVPIIVVSSAQAAPLLEPYQSSGQIQGLLSGLVGGRAYEGMTRRSANASAYWNAYQVGLGLAVLLILLGGIVSATDALLKRGKKPNQAKG